MGGTHEKIEEERENEGGGNKRGRRTKCSDYQSKVFHCSHTCLCYHGYLQVNTPAVSQRAAAECPGFCSLGKNVAALTQVLFRVV